MSIINDYKAINQRMRQTLTVVELLTPEHCLEGKCGCQSAADCKFKRCNNCDLPIQFDGKAFPNVDYWHYARGSRFECPECGAMAGTS